MYEKGLPYSVAKNREQSFDDSEPLKLSRRPSLCMQKVNSESRFHHSFSLKINF